MRTVEEKASRSVVDGTPQDGKPGKTRYMASKRAVGYVRVSTDEQVREGLSLDAQEQRITAYAASQGWELVKVYREEGESGKSLDRPRLREMLGDLDSIDLVLVYKVDRLTRRQKHLWHLLEDVFEPREIGFKSVVEPFDTTTAQGKAFLGMLAVFAQLERDTTAERTRQALDYKKANGEWRGRIPFGYQVRNGKLVEAPKQQEIIRQVKKMHWRGKSIRAIAEAVNLSIGKVHELINSHQKTIKTKYVNDSERLGVHKTDVL